MTLPSSSPTAAWHALQKGNEKFVTNIIMKRQRARIPDVQDPRYIVLSCADSRVTPEYIFNQPLGSFFVIRVAGNVVDKLVIDSIEFAVRSFNPSIILVLGHSQCGAVTGALDHLKKHNGAIGKPYDLYGTVLIPIEKTIVQSTIDIHAPDALTLSIRANVRYSADQLVAQSSIISSGIKNGSLCIIGAKYTLNTGKVTELFMIK